MISTNHLDEPAATARTHERILVTLNPLALARMAKPHSSFAGGARRGCGEGRGSHAESPARLLVTPLINSDGAEEAGDDVGDCSSL